MSETLDQLSKELLRFQEERRIAAMVRERYSNARRFPRKKKRPLAWLFLVPSQKAPGHSCLGEHRLEVAIYPVHHKGRARFSYRPLILLFLLIPAGLAGSCVVSCKFWMVGQFGWQVKLAEKDRRLRQAQESGRRQVNGSGKERAALEAAFRNCRLCFCCVEAQFRS